MDQMWMQAFDHGIEAYHLRESSLISDETVEACLRDWAEVDAAYAAAFRLGFDR